MCDQRCSGDKSNRSSHPWIQVSLLSPLFSIWIYAMQLRWMPRIPHSRQATLYQATSSPHCCASSHIYQASFLGRIIVVPNVIALRSTDKPQTSQVRNLISKRRLRALFYFRFQLERLGYFFVDTDTVPGSLVLNRTVTLKESTAKPTALLSWLAIIWIIVPTARVSKPVVAPEWSQ